MIRPIRPDDTTAPIALADATGIFGPNELEELGEVFAVAGAGSAGATGVAAGSVETEQSYSWFNYLKTAVSGDF
ncbi:hypothetical protein [Microcoleus sp. herbarium2]|uniref:hypothetical protein n=1 Tax=Microcoleus sp. herbarium2 TaxID=3055433 RepID=UPI002FD12E28